MAQRELFKIVKIFHVIFLNKNDIASACVNLMVNLIFNMQSFAVL